MAHQITSDDISKQNDELYRSMFDNMLNGFDYCQMLYEDGKPQDFIYLAVNAAFVSQTGLTDVTGKRATEVIPGIRESDPVLFEIYGRVAMNGRPEKFEMFVEALQMWFLISVYCPATEHFVAVFDVITEQKRAVDSLRASEQRHRMLSEIMLHGLVYQDANGEIISMNPAAERILGMSRDEYIGRSSVEVENLTVRENGKPFPGMEHPAMVALTTGLPVSAVVMGVYNPRLSEWVRVQHSKYIYLY